MSTSRIEGMSDGVFAIAITLLVIDLAVPEGGSAIERLLHSWPFLLAYLVSFLTIGAAWLSHKVMTDKLAEADSVYLRLTLLMLLCASFLPFPTRLVAESIDDEGGERVFVALYGLTLLAIRLSLRVLDAYARSSHLYRVDTDDEDDNVDHSFVSILVGYLVAVGIGVLFPLVAVVLYCAIALFLMVPWREMLQLARRR